MERNEQAEQELNEQIEKELDQEEITVTENNLIKHIKSRQIKAKLKAIEFVLENFDKLPSESKDSISESVSDFLKEANPTLVENSLDLIQKLFEIGKSAFIKPMKTFKALLEKTMTQPKKSIIEKSETLLIPLAEKIQKEDLIEIFKTMLANKNPKVHLSCFSALKILVAEFGIRHFGDFKEIFSLLEKAISTGNNSVKAKGAELYIELWKFMGELMKDEKAKLSKFVVKDIEDGLADWKGDLRRGRREQILGGAGRKKVDIYDLAEEVDIWSKYKEKWTAAVLKKAKWSEKLEDLEALNKDMEVVKLANGAFRPALEMLKRLLDDSNANVQIAAVRGIGLMCKGLRNHFKGVLNLTKGLIAKLKNRKSTMSEEVSGTILNFLLVTKLGDFADIFKENFKDKNPVLKINLLDLAKESIEVKLKQNEKSDCEVFLFKIKSSFEHLNKDAAKEVREKLAEFLKFVSDHELSYDNLPEISSTTNLVIPEIDFIQEPKDAKSDVLANEAISDKKSENLQSIHDKISETNLPSKPKPKILEKSESLPKVAPPNPYATNFPPNQNPPKTELTPTPGIKSFLKDPNKLISKPNLTSPQQPLFANQASTPALHRPSLRNPIALEPKSSSKQLPIPKFPSSSKNIMMAKSLLPQGQGKNFLNLEALQSQVFAKNMADSYHSNFPKEFSYQNSILSKQSQTFDIYHAEQSGLQRYQHPLEAPLSAFSAHQIDESVVLEDSDEEIEDESFWQNNKKDYILKRLSMKLNRIDGVDETNDLLIKLQRHTNDFKEVENLKSFAIFLENLAQNPNVSLNATSYVVLKNILVKDLSKPKPSGALFPQICEKLLSCMGPFRFYAMLFNYMFDKQYVNNAFLATLVELLAKTPSQLLTDQQVVLLHRAVEFFYGSLPSLPALSAVVRYIVSERLFELKDEFPELLYVDLSNIQRPGVGPLEFAPELFEEFSVLKSRGQEEFAKFSRPVLVDEEVGEILKFHQSNPKKKLITLEKLYLLLLRYSKFYFGKKDLDDKFQILLADCLNGNEANKQALKLLSIIWFLYSHANGFDFFLISKKFITIFCVIMLREKNDQIRINFARTLQRHLTFDSIKNIPSFFKLLDEKSPELKLSLLFILSERLDQMKESEIISLDKAKVFTPLFNLLREKKKEVKEKAEELLEFLLTFFREDEILKLMAKQPSESKDFVANFYAVHNNSQLNLKSPKGSHSPKTGSTINFLQFDVKDYNIYEGKRRDSKPTSIATSRVASRDHQKRVTVNINIDDKDLDCGDFRIGQSGLDRPGFLGKSMESTQQLIGKLDFGIANSRVLNSGKEEASKVKGKKGDPVKKPILRTQNSMTGSRKLSKDYILDDFIRFEVLEKLVPFEILTNLNALLEEIFSFPVAELIRNSLMEHKGQIPPNFFLICEKMHQKKFIGKRNIKFLFLCLLKLVLYADLPDQSRKEKVLERLSWFVQNLEFEDGAKIKLSGEEFEIFCEILERLDFKETQKVVLRDDIVQRVIVENISTEAKLRVLGQIFDQGAQRPWMVTSIKQEIDLHERRTKIMIDQKEGILFCFAFGPENDILDIFIGNDSFSRLFEKDCLICVKGFLLLFERFKKTIMYKHFWNEKFMIFILDNCWELIKDIVEQIEKEVFVQLVRVLIDLFFCGMCYSHPKINRLIRNLICGASRQKILGSLLYLEMGEAEENGFLQRLLVSAFENLPYAELSSLASELVFNPYRRLNAFGEYIRKFREEEEALKQSGSLLLELRGLIEVYKNEVK